MSFLHKSIAGMTGLALVLALCVSAAFAQQATGTLRGQIVDELGGAIVGATVTATDERGVEKSTTTNGEGNYVLGGLPPGRYTVRAAASGFAVYENTEVDVLSGRREPLDITLSVTIEQQNVTVQSEVPLSTEPANNADQVVLTGKDLDALPDDPDELAAALQALAGPSAGPNGGQMYIDGFTGGRLPPKESIREIRINQNPFAAENDQPAGGRIDILTKPGTDKLRGQVFFNFNDESLNSRNPFAPNRAPFQVRQYGGNLSGPIISKKSSYFLDFERRETSDNDVVNATILDPALNITPFGLAVVIPRRFMTFSPRVDYQLNPSNTIIARYSYNRTSTKNGGIGGFSLPERAFDSSSTQQTFQLTETAVISPTVVNETRFQFVRQRAEQLGDNTIPTLNVLEAFTSGGSQVGRTSNTENRWELQNYTTWTSGRHSLKAGVRLRGVRITDNNPQNFGGTYTFAGGVGPQLDSGDQLVLDAQGNPVPVALTSIERYRRTLLFQRQGLTAAQIRALGGGATQFRINAGNPVASVSQVDFGGFIQDDWRVRPDLTLSLGLRYEAQTNIGSRYNFAPRLAFAWSPGAGAGSTRPPKTVVRGGAGIFYNRFSESSTLQAGRFNGENQQQFVVTDPLVLDAFPAVPPASSLTALRQLVTWRVAEDLQAPNVYTFGLQVERQLPFRFTMFAGGLSMTIRHVIRARDINAPLPGTFIPGVPASGVRPLGNIGEVYRYESSGNFRMNQFFVGVNNRLNPRISVFSSYVLAKIKNDTDGQGGGLFPADSYDLSNELGRGSTDIRHRFTLAGTVNLPWYKLTLNPFIVATSGRPFNITTGRDTNGDRLFTERPAFATDLSRPSVVVTRYGAFDLNPLPGQQIIPRNYGEGPAFFSVNLRVSRTWSFGDVPERNASSAGAGSGNTAGGGGRGGRGGGGGGGGRRGGGAGGLGGIPGLGPGGLGGGASSAANKRYNLTFSLNFQNIFNRTNMGPPVGNLSSQLFGESTFIARGFGGFGGGGGGGNQGGGNRSIQAQLRFSF
jgi:Carboxypeptidase regulatory-like domain